MKGRFTIVILLLCCAINAWGQQLHSVVGYVTSESDTLPVKTSELTFDQQGKVLVDLDFVDQSGQTYTYNEMGVLIANTNWHRDDQETCTYEYGNQTRLMTCNGQNDNGTHTTAVLDSVNKNGLVISSYYESRYRPHEDSVYIQKFNCHFWYDQEGREIYSTQGNETDGIYSCTKTSYYNSGKVAAVVRYDDPLCQHANDSSVYIYDGFDRLARAKHFIYGRPGGKFAFHDEMVISYGAMDLNAVNNSLNDSIISEYLDYWFYDFPALPGHNPSEVKLTRIDTDNPGSENEVNHGFYYSYDKTGRLTGMNAYGKVPHNDQVDFNLDMTYDEKNTAVLQLCGENYAGSRACGYTCTYEGKNMTSWSYNSEWGFPFRTTKYVYTYYE